MRSPNVVAGLDGARQMKIELNKDERNREGERETDRDVQVVNHFHGNREITTKAQRETASFPASF